MQPAAIVFPDAELWLTTHLRATLSLRPETYAANTFVSNRVPQARRERMVIIRRDGGPATGTLDIPRFGVNVWAGSEQDAADLARLTAALILNAPGDGVCVRMTQIAGATPIIDESRESRRYMTFEAALRGEMEL